MYKLKWFVLLHRCSLRSSAQLPFPCRKVREVAMGFAALQKEKGGKRGRKQESALGDCTYWSSCIVICLLYRCLKCRPRWVFPMNNYIWFVLRLHLSSACLICLFEKVERELASHKHWGKQTG
ncbi:hypothetical protein, unlikely [Trypanosoma brucei gambiense DAL972]|uniref:T. brucei spp.-specific protein n=1 Tax=Trypanosoma brucei gambiense (strain MHOM/CI/86/DAL972) TaxID=679716 RepID=D0A0G5_TRYB9|nr:hypothetical protein, unlikely [Trypanosoma brucei gambiense DAL972]CBH16723.1 hypothetical protein, unlikely [Trypanosoma brucei gambiense DAL972]|eukprot:XP_011778987.1 hypothetical protein, unlikely [Trypanosoma brucei gambiense DAL972]